MPVLRSIRLTVPRLPKRRRGRDVADNNVSYHISPSCNRHFTIIADMADTVGGDIPNGAPPSRIRILSLNCWGLKFISKHRNQRMAQIGTEIAKVSPPPEIVGLQECWTQEDYLEIRERTKHILPYGKFYFSGIFGGGLAILSRWPIEESNMVRYPLNGRPAAFYRGDWFVGKGVACARIRYGSGKKDVAEVFCTHVSGVEYIPDISTDKTTASCTLRARTERQLHMPPHSPGMGNCKAHETCRRTRTSGGWSRRFQHDTPVTCT